MAVIEFVQNYDDLSTDQGYQFRFHCNRCGNGYQSSFVANKLGMAGGFLRAAGGLFGGMLGNAGNSAYEVQRAVGGTAHDGALQAAVQEIKPLFIQCHRCGTWVCEKICFNPDKGLCKQCAPVLTEELASAQANIARDQIFVKAQAVDQTGGLDAGAQIGVRCWSCGAETPGGKFCPECGVSLHPKTECAGCHAKLAPGAKFCAECGERT
jgi:hypothetical protein